MYYPKWSVDELLAILVKTGADIGKDSDGQIVIYTGYREDEDGNLAVMPELIDCYPTHELDSGEEADRQEQLRKFGYLGEA